MPRFSVLVAVCLSTLLGPTIAAADTLHVDRYSSASIENGSPEAPFKTVSAAVAAAIAGDQVQIAGGWYAENLTINAAITIEGAPGLTTRIEPPESWSIDAPGVTLRGLHFAGTGGGVAIVASQPFTLEESLVENFAIGLFLDGVTSATTIRHNRIEGCQFAVYLLGSGVGTYVLIENNQLVGRTGAFGGIILYNSRARVYNNLVSGFYNAVYYYSSPSQSHAISYVVNNLLLDGSTGVYATQVAPGELKVYANAMATTNTVVGVPTSDVIKVVDSGCGAPAGGWGVFDWGFKPNGDCVDAGWWYADADGSPNDIGHHGGPKGERIFGAPPAHFRVAWVVIHEGAAPSAEATAMMEEFRQDGVDRFHEATWGRGVLVGDEPIHHFELTPTRAAELADWIALESIEVDNDVLSRWIAQEVIAAHGDRFDFISVLNDDVVWEGWDKGSLSHHRAAPRTLGTGEFINDASAEFGSDGRLRGVGFIGNVNYWVTTDLFPSVPTQMLYHETFGHSFGANNIPGLADGHWEPHVIQPDVASGIMHSKFWTQISRGIWRWQLGDVEAVRKFHPVVMYAMGGFDFEEVEGVSYLELEGEPPQLDTDVAATKVLLPMSEVVDGWGGHRTEVAEYWNAVWLSAPTKVWFGQDVTLNLIAVASLGLDRITVEYSRDGGNPSYDIIELDGETFAWKSFTLGQGWPYYGLLPVGTYDVRVIGVDTAGNPNWIRKLFAKDQDTATIVVE